MRIYTDDLERAVRLQHLVEDWRGSGLIDSTQRARIVADLQVDLRRTNRFLRLTLIGFGLLIIVAAVGLVIAGFDLDREETVGVLCLAAAIACITLTEMLIGRFRVYRLGIEEACAIGAALLAAVGSGLLSDYSLGTLADTRSFVMLIVGSAAAFSVYLRYGYVYAALGAMLCLAFAPFQFSLPDAITRSVSACALIVCFAAARTRRRQYGDEFPGDDYGWIQAAAWLGTYAVLNLHLGIEPFGRTHPPLFYWSTYAAIWLLPAAGLWSSIRERDRPLLDVSLAMALVTLITNKPYLGLERRPWDPILFGLFLMAVAVITRRWLAAGADGSRAGFTAKRHLQSQKEIPAATGIAAATFHPDQPRPAEPSHDPFEGGGGRSGGGGGGASY